MLTYATSLSNASIVMEKLKDEVRIHDSKIIASAAKYGKTLSPAVYLSFNNDTLKFAQEDEGRTIE